MCKDKEIHRNLRTLRKKKKKKSEPLGIWRVKAKGSRGPEVSCE